MNGIGKNIKKLRKEGNLSQEQLAERLHVTRQAVSSWETGKNQPDIETLESIAAVFGTDILMVLYGRPRLEEEGLERQKQRRRCIKNGLIWGIIAFIGIAVHFLIKDRIMGWYYRFNHMVPVCLFVLFLRPVSAFAAGEALMNGLNLIGDIRIRQDWIRKAVLGAALAALVLYLAAAVFLMALTVLSDVGNMSDRIPGFSVIFRFAVPIAMTPALFMIPGVGVFLGTKR